MGDQQTAADIPDPSDDLCGTADEVLSFTVDAAGTGQRLDVVVAAVARDKNLVLSRTRIKALLDDGHLLVDESSAVDASRKLKLGEAVRLVVPAAAEPLPLGEAIPLAIVYEDEHLVVIDKPAGLVVHPAPGHSSGTLVNALIAHCGDSLSGIGGVKRPGIVHRLDKDTSGLLVVAKTDRAHRGLASLFADHGRSLHLVRRYVALLWGVPDRPSGTVDAPLGRHGTDRLRMAVVSDERGRRAITHWKLEERYGPTDAPLACRVTCSLETGRTHQIRVHMAHTRHPVLGDPLYGKGFISKTFKLGESAASALTTLNRQALHAAVLGFEHPVTRKELEFVSPLPDDLARLDASLRGI